MTDDRTRNAIARHYPALQPREQLIWRLLARRSTSDHGACLCATGEPFEEWTDRLLELPGCGKDVRLALDTFCLALLDPPAALHPGTLSTAWHALSDADPRVTLGDDAHTLEGLAQTDPGKRLDRETFEDVVMDAVYDHQTAFRRATRLPDGHGELQELVIHPAATSLELLVRAVRRGVTLHGAGPDMQAAAGRFLLAAHRCVDDTDKECQQQSLIDDLRADTRLVGENGRFSTLLEMLQDATGQHQRTVQDMHEMLVEDPVLLAHFDQMYRGALQADRYLSGQLEASIGVGVVMRLLFLPQLLPGHVNASASLAICAVLWRLCKDLWAGSPQWQADMKLLRAHLKTLGRQHDAHRKMRALEPYASAPGIDLEEAVGMAVQLHTDLINLSQLNAPDLDPVFLDLPGTNAGQLAQRLGHASLACRVPSALWGPRMRTLNSRVRRVPSQGDIERFHQNTDQDTFLDASAVIGTGARAALLLALSPAPSREVLTACAAALAQLRDAVRKHAPIAGMTDEFAAALRVLWRSLGSPACSWLTAIRGPDATETAAWERQLENLIQAALAPPPQGTPDPTRPGPAMPDTHVPDFYAPVLFTPWEHTEETDAQDTEEVPFQNGLSDTEQLVLNALEGRTMVILGGICKPYAKAALIRDLKLKDVDWIESSEYDHGQHAAFRLRDPDVACVIFALRWAAHAHGSIRNAAWALGIPAVSLPGGYNPRQVLHQLSVQISDKLTA